MLADAFVEEGCQGTSWKPSPFPIVANRPLTRLATSGQAATDILAGIANRLGAPSGAGGWFTFARRASGLCLQYCLLVSHRRAMMPEDLDPDDLTAVLRYALDTTRATIVCPFHDDLTIRVATMQPRATHSNAPRESSGATARPGKEKFSGKSFVSSLAPRRTAAARSAILPVPARRGASGRSIQSEHEKSAIASQREPGLISSALLRRRLPRTVRPVDGGGPCSRSPPQYGTNSGVHLPSFSRTGYISRPHAGHVFRIGCSSDI